jgi:dTDP-4-dehydrorhamnose reductase
MHILLLGHRGYVGGYLHKHLKYEHDIFPLQDRYDCIVNCVGKPNLEYCEENPEVSEVSNYKVIIPYMIKYPKAKVINFSSYYVYDAAGLCTETSNVTRKYMYTLHNLLCEELVTFNGGVSFRLGKVFGNIESIGKGKLTEYIIKNDILTLDSVMFNPVSVYQIQAIVEYELDNNNMYGVYNAANLGSVDSYNYGVFMDACLKSCKHITRVDKMSRLFHNYGRFLMSVDKLNSVLPLTDWRIDMIKYLEEIKCIV